MKTQKFSRVPFDVQAVQVTAENMAEIAEWCKGEIRVGITSADGEETKPYIKIKVFRPLHERQTKAFIGDWVLDTTTGFKVYTEKAMAVCFAPAEDESRVITSAKLVDIAVVPAENLVFSEAVIHPITEL